MVSSVSGDTGVTLAQLDQMSLDTALMTVQVDRANILEAGLKDQVLAIGARNQEMVALNKLMSELRALRPSGSNPDQYGNMGATTAAGREMLARVQAAGLTVPDANGPDRVDEPGTNIFDAKQKTYDVWIEQIKGKIDALSNTQQMDMLRVQSLNNKRNEAFELITNFVKKMSDNRATIIANIR